MLRSTAESSAASAVRRCWQRIDGGEVDRKKTTGFRKTKAEWEKREKGVKKQSERRRDTRRHSCWKGWQCHLETSCDSCVLLWKQDIRYIHASSHSLVCRFYESYLWMITWMLKENLHFYPRVRSLPSPSSRFLARTFLVRALTSLCCHAPCCFHSGFPSSPFFHGNSWVFPGNVFVFFPTIMTSWHLSAS